MNNLTLMGVRGDYFLTQNTKIKMPTKIFNQQSLLSNRKKLRNNSTPFEIILWNYLKGSKLQNRKFRRQHSIGKYIADFYCPTEKLIIEIDGESHFINSAAVKHDQRRTVFFNSLGIRVLRFTNYEIAKELEGVLFRIVESFGDN